MARLMVTVFHTASWTMSIPGFFRFLPRPLMSKQTRRLEMSTVVAVVKEVQRTVHIQVQRLGHPVGLWDALRQKRSIRSPRMGIFSGLGSAK